MILLLYVNTVAMGASNVNLCSSLSFTPGSINHVTTTLLRLLLLGGKVSLCHMIVCLSTVTCSINEKYTSLSWMFHSGSYNKTNRNVFLLISYLIVEL